MLTFKEAELRRQISLIDSGFFGKDRGNGYFRDKQYKHFLGDGLNNLCGAIRKDAIRYFRDNKVSWWGGSGPTGNVLSSQIACLNHLMPIRKNRMAVLKMVNKICCRQFVDVLPLCCDKNRGYIAFEVVSAQNYMNEKVMTRGANCTSIDATVLARDESGKRWLLAIEWKYTESYNSEGDKSAGAKGRRRSESYLRLIENSRQLRVKGFSGTPYACEPFYQLMRQTLLAEQMIEHYKAEKIKADDFMHLHVIPKGNVELLEKRYDISGKNMEETWRGCIADTEKYIIVNPRDIVESYKDEIPDLHTYLLRRYYS